MHDLRIGMAGKRFQWLRALIAFVEVEGISSNSLPTTPFPVDPVPSSGIHVYLHTCDSVHKLMQAHTHKQKLY